MHGPVRVFVLQEVKAPEVQCSLSHWLVGVVEGWARVGRGACAGHKSAQYLMPRIQSYESKSQMMMIPTGILEKDKEGKLCTVRCKTHEQDRIAARNQGYAINPCIAYIALMNGGGIKSIEYVSSPTEYMG